MSARASNARLAELTKRWFDGMTAEDVSPVILRTCAKTANGRTPAREKLRDTTSSAPSGSLLCEILSRSGDSL